MTEKKDGAAPAAANDSPYLYEFLYRGRAPGSTEDPAYHVILAQDVKDAFGQVSTATSPALTPRQAEDRGFDLDRIVAGLNAGLTKESETAKAALAAAQGEIAGLAHDLDAARAALDAAEAETAALRVEHAAAGRPPVAADA